MSDNIKKDNVVNLSTDTGLYGSYPQQLTNGDILVYDWAGKDGEGIYRLMRMGCSLSNSSELLYKPEKGTAFDAFIYSDTNMLITKCFDDNCACWQKHGIWDVELASGKEVHLEYLPYVWGAQLVPALGLLIFTDGEDILAVPDYLLDDASKWLQH